MNDAFLFILIVLLLVPVGIVAGFYGSVKAMQAWPGLRRVPDSDEMMVAALPPELSQFLKLDGFEFMGAYKFHLVQLGMWEQTGDTLPLRRLFLTHVRQRTNYELTTEFNERISLTTTRSQAAFMMPRPFGSFVQSFPSASAAEMREAHRRGEEFLISRLSTPLEKCSLPFQESMHRGHMELLSHLKTFSFWPLRGIYWYLVKRFRMHNRPIWSQDLEKEYKRLG